MFTNYMENKVGDAVLRGQALPQPSSYYVGLLTAAPAEDGTITEVAYAGYARQPIASTLAGWSGTQGAGTTTVSSGTSGEHSNNAALTFPTPASNVATPVTHFGLFDAASGGNLCIYGPINNSSGVPSPKSLTAGDPVVVPIGALKLTFDV